MNPPWNNYEPPETPTAVHLTPACKKNNAIIPQWHEQDSDTLVE
jgi:hypothetical protein